MYRRKRVFVYDFAQNLVPGQGEKERGYWRDVGTLDAYYQANMDLVEVDPVFYALQRPVAHLHRAHNSPPAKFVFADNEHGPRGPRHRLARLARAASSRAATSTARILSPKVRVNSYSPRWRTRSSSRT